MGQLRAGAAAAPAREGRRLRCARRDPAAASVPHPPAAGPGTVSVSKPGSVPAAGSVSDAGSGITFPIDDYQTAQLLVLILELLSFCVTQHKEHMRGYILHWDLLRVVLLINSQHTFLALSVLHFLRKIIALKDELYTHSITQGNLLAPLLQALLDDGATSNLLHWAVLELFELLRLEDCKSLVAHIIENFCPVLECITYVQAFQGLERKYERDKHRQMQSVHR
ncbi:LOW QUALITY PROTEIN: serine/threonine-protein phosphatase 4 regulatory subunit 3B-like [Passer montanus]|uniref:LOW QUALITY PROTEIN: serine/threonine-protein phosphatase 4 regulatory subunit 3B-like n=1 Tax=Passer montanus TaxID=9160 RepID=UPI00195F7C0D|nr:LOW QUALITY PROTEIN: serine/threonine-protein phosphatase 4 regulatory subunit 3B-like [Passer montanus]